MKYFTLKELTRSGTALRKGIDNTPSKEIESNLKQLVDNVLDPLREAFGKPIIVDSGYRCKKLNDAIGGSKTSQHMKGQAADIHTVEDTVESNKKLYDLIVKLNLPYDQLINEYNYNWIHVSFVPSGRHRKLKAIKINGKTIYQVVN